MTLTVTPRKDGSAQTIAYNDEICVANLHAGGRLELTTEMESYLPNGAMPDFHGLDLDELLLEAVQETGAHDGEAFEAYIARAVREAIADALDPPIDDAGDWVEETHVERGTVERLQQALLMVMAADPLLHEKLTQWGGDFSVGALADGGESGRWSIICGEPGDWIETFTDGDPDGTHYGALLPPILNYFCPRGSSREYNDGASDRLSGYSTTYEQIYVCSAEIEEMTARERMRALRELDELLRSIGQDPRLFATLNGRLIASDPADDPLSGIANAQKPALVPVGGAVD